MCVCVRECSSADQMGLICMCACSEGGGLEEDGVGKESEEDRVTQPGALYGQTFLQPGHEPLWRHGELNGPR